MPNFKSKASGFSKNGGKMTDIEDFTDSAQHCFELAKRVDLLEEDIALEAFELLTANNYDRLSAHALSVSL
jgi:hypothetical protein